MTPMSVPTLPMPNTPTKKPTWEQMAIEETLNHLNWSWNLGLSLPGNQTSPQMRMKDPTREQRCVARIKLICYKTTIKTVRAGFDGEAQILYNGWVNKPHQERGVVPDKTRNRPHPVTEKERVELLDLLLHHLEPEYAKAVELSKQSPRKAPPQESTRAEETMPIPFKGLEAKRAREREGSESPLHTKKARKSDEDMPPPLNRRPPPTPAVFGASFANTSFLSDISHTESIFSRQDSNNSSGTQNTQDTVPDEAPLLPTEKVDHTSQAFTQVQDNAPKSSDYGSSFDASLVAEVVEDLVKSGKEAITPEKIDPHTAEILSQDLLDFEFGEPVRPQISAKEQEFVDNLHKVFLPFPPILKYVSFRVAYEIMRVVLHAETSITDIKGFPRHEILENYDKLWNFLQDCPSLKDKVFPERCPKEIWEAAATKPSNQHQASRDIVFSGVFDFNETATPCFKFRLKPMTFDRSHRLSRRFGMDRFLEIDIPQLSNRHIPAFLKTFEERGPKLIHSWLINPEYTHSPLGHPILGRVWKPFFVKPKDKKKRRQAHNDDPDINRLYFFAVSGSGLDRDRGKVDIPELLDFVRPTCKNGHQPYLKLFARTQLALSRTTPTITLEPSQILRKDDIRHSFKKDGKDEKGKVMTDGAGRISPSLAVKVINHLGLSYPPSAFQARLGEAKGLWIIDYRSDRPGDWIELYDSQRKWVPDFKNDHPTHRTFEVLRWSGPLKSADLNLQFLPLLVQRSEDRRAMRKSLEKILKDGLETELESIEQAMEHPESFRKWLRENNSNIDDRLKCAMVPYKASFPVQTHERLNTLLDSGFEPKSCGLIRDLAFTAFKNKCAELTQKLNITVGRSAYAYMVPDFWDVLEEGEVFIDFSSFIDNDSGFAGVSLDKKEVLVARSPANYGSDIQKVTVAFKTELIGLKDVIVFSTKGIGPSLAEKLSGGDYDGDIAWVCWEEAIVQNFKGVGLPEFPDLVKEGLIQQNKRSYNELEQAATARGDDPTSEFLKECFAFNMPKSMLGICTSYKDNLVYTTKSYDNEEAVYLSTLLSNLVDQAKQGYTFTSDDWNLFIKKVVKTKVKAPSYKENNYANPKSNWIIDQLMIVAEKAVEKALSKFSKKESPSNTDADLLVEYKKAKANATAMKNSKDKSDERKPKYPEWKSVFEQLDHDIQEFKNFVSQDTTGRKAKSERRFQKVNSGSFSETTKSASFHDPDDDFMANMERYYARFQKILPVEDNGLTASLLPGYFSEDGEVAHIEPDAAETSPWALLRASALFSAYTSAGTSRVPWFIAGKQLCMLKAKHSGKGVPHWVVPSMYAMLKPDASYVKRSQSQRAMGLWDEGASVVNGEEAEDTQDDF